MWQEHAQSIASRGLVDGSDHRATAHILDCVGCGREDDTEIAADEEMIHGKVDS